MKKLTAYQRASWYYAYALYLEQTYLRKGVNLISIANTDSGFCLFILQHIPELNKYSLLNMLRKGVFLEIAAFQNNAYLTLFNNNNGVVDLQAKSIFYLLLAHQAYDDYCKASRKRKPFLLYIESYKYHNYVKEKTRIK